MYKIDLLKHTIVNTVKSLGYGMKQKDRIFLRDIYERMLEHKTTVLSRLGDTDNKESTKSLRGYLSKHLGQDKWSNLPEKVTKIMCKFIGNPRKETDFFCFDTVDINKNSAKKMEGLKKVRDATRNTFGSGYVLHGVSVKGIPLLLEREGIKENEDDMLRIKIFTKQLEDIFSLFGTGYWILADRGYDDFKKFNLLIEKGFNFCIRLKSTRNITILDGYKMGEIVKISDLEEGKYRVKITGVKQDLFIFVKALKGQTTPIKVISNIDDETAVEKYLNRWEIERIFKTIKQEYGFEKIGTKSLQKIDNLVALAQLCMGTSAYIFNKLEEEKGQRETGYTTVTSKKLRQKKASYFGRKETNLNRNSITNFLSYYMKFVKKMKYFIEKVTLKHVSSSQIRLFE
ncbi:transposase [Candidatus Gracilibacteria bacterium]|nr:transposase [Candidatus Gracilibacteria bacterium]